MNALAITIALVWLELRLAGQLLWTALLVRPLFLVALSTLMGYLLVLWFADGDQYLGPIAALYLVLGVMYWFRMKAYAEVESTDLDPLMISLSELPILQQEVDKVAAEFHRRAPRRIQIILSPTPEYSHQLALPVGCLGIWSVYELRCHIASSLLRRRSPRLLMRWMQRQGRTLWAELYQYEVKGVQSRWRSWIQNNLDRQQVTLQTWLAVAQAEADSEIAAVYGTSTASWIQKDWLAQIGLPWFRDAFVGPAAARELLFPVAEGYQGFHPRLESEPKLLEPIQWRLEELHEGQMGMAISDSRSATAMVPELPELEERLVRWMLELPDAARLRRVSWNEFSTELLEPSMREEIARNQGWLAGHTAADLPLLVRDADRLGPSYQPHPSLLVDPEQRSGLIRDLLVSFLTIELIDLGWSLGFDPEQGILLIRGSHKVDPHQAVEALNDGELTAEEFLAQSGLNLLA